MTNLPPRPIEYEEARFELEKLHDKKARKKKKTEIYYTWVYKWKLRPCACCNGSGYYDHNNSPECAACNGTGEEWYNSQLENEKE